MTPESLRIQVDEQHSVSALALQPARPVACYVFAHGAGADMMHASMESMAQALSGVGIATLRFQFPYMERGSGRPDAPSLCHATIRAANAEAARHWPDLPRIAGGRSFGGRMTSQAQVADPLDGVRGLAFLAFPLHPAGKPSAERAQHLSEVRVPMLFVQGDRDALAQLDLLAALIDRLSARSTWQRIEGADHSFRVPARSGRKPADVVRGIAAGMRGWLDALLER
jgi:predicted alpha/beta-hydrolase family hydrolase